MTVRTVSNLPAATHGETVRCLFAIELSKQSWVIGFITPLSTRVSSWHPSFLDRVPVNRKPWWDCEPVLQSKEQERKPLTYSGARPISIPVASETFAQPGRRGRQHWV